jgi:hypothetical protein
MIIEYFTNIALTKFQDINSKSLYHANCIPPMSRGAVNANLILLSIVLSPSISTSSKNPSFVIDVNGKGKEEGTKPLCYSGNY